MFHASSTSVCVVPASVATVVLAHSAATPAAESALSIARGVTDDPPDPLVGVCRRATEIRSPSSAASPTSDVCESSRPRSFTGLSSAGRSSSRSTSPPAFVIVP